jgi:hypothetical protein
VRSNKLIKGVQMSQKRLSKQDIVYQLSKPYTFRELESKHFELEKAYFDLYTEAEKMRDTMKDILDSYKEDEESA